MKKIFSFFCLFYFFPLLIANRYLTYLEISHTDVPSKIIETFVFNETLFFVSTEDSQLTIFNIEDLEKPPIQINTMRTSMPFATFLVSNNNYLIALGISIGSNLTILKVFQIQDPTNIIPISSLEMPKNTSKIRDLICINKECDYVSYVDEQWGIRLINLTSKEFPQEIAQSGDLKDYKTSQTLVVENEVISSFDDVGMVALNISNLTNIQTIFYFPFYFITSLTSYNQSVILMTCPGAVTGTGTIYQWMVQGYESYVISPEWSDFFFGMVYIAPIVCICSPERSTPMKFYDQFIMITRPTFQLILISDWSSFAFGVPDDSYMLKRNENYYNIFIFKEDRYFLIDSLFNISKFPMPYTLANCKVFNIDIINLKKMGSPQATLVVGNDSHKYLITASSQPAYYSLLNPKAPVAIGFLGDFVYNANSLWADVKKRYFMVFGYFTTIEDEPNPEGYIYKMLIYDYELNANHSLASVEITSKRSLGFVVYPIQFDDLLYLFPITWNAASKVRNYLFVVNITDIDNLVIEDTNVEAGTGKFQSGIGSCQKNGEKIIFIKREAEPKIFFYRISSTSYTFLEVVGEIFVPYTVAVFETSEDCNYLYAGGDVFYTIEIFDFAHPRILSTLNINQIEKLKVIKEKLYLISPTIIYLFDLSNHNPVFISSGVHPLDEQAKNYVYNIDILQANYSNYIYKGSHSEDSNGGTEITIYEVKMLYFLYLKQNKDLIVGVPITYNYYCINLQTYNEIKGVISSVSLTNATANFPTLTSLPSWISFDFNAQEVTITVPKNYQYENLSIVFEMKNTKLDNPEIYSQMIAFPKAFSSLSYNLDPYIIVKTPSTSNIQIKIKHYPNIKFIFLSFAGVFVSYSEEKGVVIASGLLEALNEMFTKLRVTNIETAENYPQSFNLTIQDYLNNDIVDSITNYNENVLRFNQPPKCSIENFQELFDNQSSYLVPDVKFSFDIQSRIFSDPELDPLSYQIFSQNNDNLPSWLNFDPSNLRFYGTPSSDLGLLNISLRISDGFDFIIKNFHLNISDSPPHISIPISTQVLKNNITIGENFLLNLHPLTFQDEDGPHSLQYLVFFEDINNKRKQVTSTSSYWLKFDDTALSFSGSPSFEDCSYYGNNVTISVIASDGVENSSDSFVISIFPSLKKQTSQINSLPLIEYLENKQLSMDVLVNNGSILILNDFLSNYSSKIEYSIDETMKNITVTTTVEIINKVFSYLVYRNVEETQQGNYSIISYRVNDNLGQNISGEIHSNQIICSNVLPKIDKSFIQDYYLAEIGTNFRILISKKLLQIDTPNMKLNYSFTMKNSFNVKQNWLYFQENNENIEIFSGGNIESSYLGKYQGILLIMDEFKKEYTHELILEVDYSFLDKFKNYLQLISTIVGPIISVLAFSKFFYFIYNWMWRKKIERKDFYLKVDTPFKIKVPLIEEEFKLASELYSKILGACKKEDEKYLQSFLKTHIMHQTIPLATQNNFEAYFNKFFKGEPQKKNLIITLTEGLLIKDLVEKFAHASSFLKELELETIKTQTSEVDEWYNQFFFDENLKNIEDLKEMLTDNATIEKIRISDYVLQVGTYKSVEKNIYMLGHYYEFIFEKTVSRMKKIKFNDEQLSILKFLILRAIIEIKRGIPFNYSRKTFILNNFLTTFGIRVLPYNFGDAVHLPDSSVKYIKTFEERREHEDFSEKKSAIMRKIKKIQQNLFSYRPYFSINDKSFPDWLHVDMKKGYLIFHGTPYKEELKKRYLIRICTGAKFNIMQFKLIVSEVDQLSAKAVTLSRRMTKDPKIRNTMLKETTKKISTEEKKNIISHGILSSPHRELLKSEEFNDYLDEKIDVEINVISKIEKKNQNITLKKVELEKL